MMGSYLLKGLLIGLLFGLPVGAVGAMTVQRTWSLGFKAGLLTGLGSSVADCLYAIVGAFGLTLISDFLLRYQTMLSLLGGGLILLLGLRLLLKKGEMAVVEGNTTGWVKLFLSSFVIGVTNPSAILTFLFAFSYFGITGVVGIMEGAGLVGGVFMGTYLWWGALSAVTCVMRKKTGSKPLRYINKVFGGLLTAFGTVVFIKLFW